MSEPSLVFDKILTPAINVAIAPGAPKITLRIDLGTVCLEDVIIDAVSPNGQQAVSVNAAPPPYPPMPARESLTIQLSSPFRK